METIVVELIVLEEFCVYLDCEIGGLLEIQKKEQGD